MRLTLILPLGTALAEEREVVALYGETSSPVSIPLLPRFLFKHRSKGYLEALCPRLLKLRKRGMAHLATSRCNPLTNSSLRQ